MTTKQRRKIAALRKAWHKAFLAMKEAKRMEYKAWAALKCARDSAGL